VTAARGRPTLGCARGISCVEVSPAAIRTVGEPGFALFGSGQTCRTVVTAGWIRLRQWPPLAQHQAIASGMASSCSAVFVAQERQAVLLARGRRAGVDPSRAVSRLVRSRAVCLLDRPRPRPGRAGKRRERRVRRGSAGPRRRRWPSRRLRRLLRRWRDGVGRSPSSYARDAGHAGRAHASACAGRQVHPRPGRLRRAGSRALCSRRRTDDCSRPASLGSGLTCPLNGTVDGGAGDRKQLGELGTGVLSGAPEFDQVGLLRGFESGLLAA